MKFTDIFINEDQRILVENAQQYKQMMQIMVDAEFITANNANGLIKTLREKFKRNDRIVWILRHYRLGLVYNYIKEENPQGEDLQKAEALLKKVSKGIREAERYKDRAATLINIWNNNTLNHYLSMFSEIPNMEALEWKNQTPSELDDQLETLESKWRQESKQNVKTDVDDHPEFEILKRYRDQAWVLLDSEYCRLEGGAMGHCGNTAEHRDGQRILSFRTIKDENTHKPHLTFILNKNGTLGEMKGRANEKPNSKYHPFIIDLLKSDLVTGIKGGGYAPRNNFEMKDLPEETREELLELKPLLGGFAYAMQKGAITAEQFEDYVNSYDWYSTPLQWGDIQMTRSEDNILLSTMTESQISEFIKDGLGRNHQHMQYLVKNVVGDGGDLYMNAVDMTTMDDYESLYDSLSDEWKRGIKQYIIDETPEDEMEDLREIVDEDDFDDDYWPFSAIWDVTEQIANFDELRYPFIDGAEYGYESGIQSEMYKNFINTIEGWGIEFDRSKGIYEWIVSFKEVMSFIQDYDEGDDYAHDNFIEHFGVDDAQAPYHGYSDFDEDYAKDSMEDRLYDLGISEAPAEEKPKSESIDRIKTLAGLK